MLVAWLVAVTLAPGTTAPCGSTTVPEICALDALCAFAMKGKQQHKKAIIQNCCRRFIEDLLESRFISLSVIRATAHSSVAECKNRETRRILNLFLDTSSENRRFFTEVVPECCSSRY